MTVSSIVLLASLLWVGPAVLVGALAVRRKRIFFAAFLVSLIFTPIGGLLYCFLVPQFAFEKDRATAMLVDLFIANACAVPFFFLPLHGWIMSDFQLVFGDTTGRLIVGLLSIAPVLVLMLVAAGNAAGLAAVKRLRAVSESPPTSRPATVLTMAWSALVTLRIATFLVWSW